jgi:negative regulator of flagellin synthesis FlgM
MEYKIMKLDPRLSLTGGPVADPIKKPESKPADGGLTRSKAEDGATGLSEDRVTLSTSANDVQRLTTAVNDVPEVRADRVSALQQKVRSGRYTVDREKLADALVSEQPRLNVKA